MYIRFYEYLHLEDDPLDAVICLDRPLRKKVWLSEISRVDTHDDFIRQVEHCAFDLILADYSLPGF